MQEKIIPLVVDKNDDNGNYVSSSEAKLFVNEEPIARTLTCKCGGGQGVHHNNMVCVAMRGGNIQPKIIEDFYANRPARVYEEVSPTIRAERAGLKVIDLYNETVKDDGICGTLTASGGLGWKNCGSFGVIEKSESDKIIVAMRGRNPENPTDRTPEIHTEQRLEMNKEGLVNILTTVQKDNLCLEIKKVGQISNDGLCSTLTAGTHGYANNCISVKQATKEGSIKCKVGGCYDASYPDSKTRRGRVQEGGDVTPTITAQGGENINYVETQYRIRRLTPKECWRLMGYTDKDFEKSEKVNSNTQLYKQAGNAIVKQVLMAIFAQMIPESARQKKTIRVWQDSLS